MIHARLAVLLLFAAANASAQGTKAPAKPDSTKAAATKSVTTAPVTQVDAKADAKAQGAKAADVKAPDTKTNAKAPAAQPTGTKVATPGGAPAGQARPGVVVAPPPAPVVQVPAIMREAYGYAPEGRRDPFISLLTSAELRPTVADLRLTGILYDESGRNSYATMRDLVTDVQYRVTTGQILGRMRVALIKRTVVLFSIEEFGLNRTDSLFLGDTTKVRAK